MQAAKAAAQATRGSGRAAFVEIVAYVATIALRLASNLLLTRLLFPEAFGLMALFHSVNYVLWMLSDVGIMQAVIMSKRGAEQKFLDTAFTIQVVRGVLLWLITCALTYPLVLIYNNERELLWILPVGAFATVLHGFQSPRVFLLRKEVRPLPLLKLDLSTQFIATALTVLLAYLGFGVKSMIISWLALSFMYAAGSYMLPGDYRPKLRMDKDSRHEIMHFGRWIFFSSALTSVAQKGDQFLLGRLLGFAELGIYNIAQQLAEMPETMVSKVINSAVYPTLSRVKNEQPAVFSDAFYHIRGWLDPLIFIGLGGLIGMARWIIELFYDDRYLLAATVLQVLAARAGIQVLALLCETCFTAHGESQFSFKRNLFVSVTLMIAMPVGAWLYGFKGVLWGSVVARGTALFALWPEARRRGYVRLHREFLAVPYGAIGFAIAWLLVTYGLPDGRTVQHWLACLFGRGSC